MRDPLSIQLPEEGREALHHVGFPCQYVRDMPSEGHTI